MIFLIGLLSMILALVGTFIIDINRMINWVHAKGEQIPEDPIMIVRLWYDYFDDEL